MNESHSVLNDHSRITFKETKILDAHTKGVIREKEITVHNGSREDTSHLKTELENEEKLFSAHSS